MLNRRHLRVKVLQALYAYHQSQDKDIRAAEKKLLKSVDEVAELYMWLLSLLVETADYAIMDADERANKHLPTENDLNVDVKLHHNKFITALRANEDYVSGLKKYKISWNFDPEIARSIFTTLKSSPEYGAYLNQEEHNIKTDKDIIKFLFRTIIMKSAVVEQLFEEKFINYPIDKEVLQALVAKTLKNFSNENPKENKLPEILPNWEDDREFIITLFSKVIAFDTEYQKYIADKTKNWEAERIAMMDVLLMKLAITELVHFNSIPVKVSINEYIELSKEYSTPKSNSFINGILDKILVDLKENGKIRKFGRGLLE